MNIERARRYKEKLDIISERENQIKEWVSNYSLEEFISDTKTKLATYKAIQEIVEATLDICAMIVKDLNLLPKDDFSNLNTLQGKNILSNELFLFLQDANSLRNRLIHLYNKVDDKVIFRFLDKLLTNEKVFRKTILEWLTKN